jgi:hypothetical protein
MSCVIRFLKMETTMSQAPSHGETGTDGSAVVKATPAQAPASGDSQGAPVQSKGFIENSKPWLGAVAAVVAIIGTVCGGMWKLYQHVEQKAHEIKEELKKDEDRRTQELNQRKREYNLALFKEKRTLYHPLCKATGIIAASRTLPEAKDAVRDFLTLFYGEAHLISHPGVTEAKNAFHEELISVLQAPQQIVTPELRLASLQLAEACRKELTLEKTLLRADDQ